MYKEHNLSTPYLIQQHINVNTFETNHTTFLYELRC